jgi:predicted HTH transcriptional regulator
MTTFGLPIVQIDAARLNSLLGGAVREGTQLDFKERLPGNADDDKREFLSDVTSFANTIGGDILYGVKERRTADGKPSGEAEEIVGLPSTNIDAERLRLESILLTGVDPRIAGVVMQEIRRDAEPPCLLIRIPRSLARPHMAGKYQLDVREIRTAFVTGEIAIERVRRFRADRLSRVIADEGPMTIAGDVPGSVELEN